LRRARPGRSGRALLPWRGREFVRVQF